MLETLPLDKLHPSPDNPRRDLGDLTDLAASIRSVGLVHALLACPDGAGGYTVVAGHRRLAAAKEAGLAEVRCEVRELDDAQRAEIMLVENCQRADLTALEEARTYRRLVDDLDYSQRRLAERVGRSQSHVSKRLALLTLPETVQDKVDSGRITAGEAAELVKLADEPDAVLEVIEACENGWMDIDRAVRRRLADRERLAKRAATLAKLGKRKGLSVIDAPDAYSLYNLQGKQVMKLGKGYGELPIARGTHAKSGCHAAVVLRDATVDYVCTKPSNHPEARKTEVTPPHVLEERRRQKARKADAVARAAFIADQLARTPVTGDVIDLTLAGWLRTSQQNVLAKACKLLDIDAPRVGGIIDRRAGLAGHAAGGADAAARTLAAIAHAAHEVHLENAWYRWGVEEASYFSYLTDRGYEPTDHERDELAKVDADA